MKDFGLGLRRACALIGLSRSSFAYVPKLDPVNEAVMKRLKELAEKRKRFGSPRLHVLLRREGFKINHKRTERLYYAMGLSIRIRRRKKTASTMRVEVPRPAHRNHIWCMDFMRDGVSGGRILKVFALIDEYTRKCFRIDVDTSITGAKVVRVLSEVTACEGLPEIIIIDNGPEFISRALDEWAYSRGVKLFFISPGKPVENSYIESFNGKLRDECLNAHYFMSIYHAQQIVEDWRVDYNTERPHSSLDNQTPEEFILSIEQKSAPAVAGDTGSINADYPKG